MGKPIRLRGAKGSGSTRAQWFKGVEVHCEYDRATVLVSRSTLEPEMIRSVTFYCGTRTVRREVRGVISTERPRDCLKFNFSFGVEGTRGKPHPPPTPTEDLDELYG